MAAKIENIGRELVESQANSMGEDPLRLVSGYAGDDVKDPTIPPCHAMSKIDYKTCSSLSIDDHEQCIFYDGENKCTRQSIKSFLKRPDSYGNFTNKPILGNRTFFGYEYCCQHFCQYSEKQQVDDAIEILKKDRETYTISPTLNEWIGIMLDSLTFWKKHYTKSRTKTFGKSETKSDDQSTSNGGGTTDRENYILNMLYSVAADIENHNELQSETVNSLTRAFWDGYEYIEFWNVLYSSLIDQNKKHKYALALQYVRGFLELMAMDASIQQLTQAKDEVFTELN